MSIVLTEQNREEKRSAGQSHEEDQSDTTSLHNSKARWGLHLGQPMKEKPSALLPGGTLGVLIWALTSRSPSLGTALPSSRRSVAGSVLTLPQLPTRWKYNSIFRANHTVDSDANKKRLDSVSQLALTLAMKMTENTMTFSHLQVAPSIGESFSANADP